MSHPRDIARLSELGQDVQRKAFALRVLAKHLPDLQKDPALEIAGDLERHASAIKSLVDQASGGSFG